MANLNVLSDEDLNFFEKNGYVRVNEAFPGEAALAMQDFMWERLKEMRGIDRHDPDTWTIWTNGLNKSGENPIYRQVASERMCGAIDQLLGAENWRVPSSWGGFLVTFPVHMVNQTDLFIGEWHWDTDAGEHLDGMAGLFIFTFYSEVAPRGGGTLIVPGSHRLIMRFFEKQSMKDRQRKLKLQKKLFEQTHPWLTDLNSKAAKTRDLIQQYMDEPVEVDGVSVRVLEMTGKPGDAVICHPAMYHARTPNHADVPRFMCAKMVKKLGEDNNA